MYASSPPSVAGRRGHAIVCGASMTGLVAARALSAHFARVTLVERDALSGRDACETTFPGQGAGRCGPEKTPGEGLPPREVGSVLRKGRKGVPQASHAHGLLTSGYRVLEEYFPGVMEELAEEGASRCDVTGDCLWHHAGGWKLRKASGLPGIIASRALLEAHTCERVKRLPNVELLDGHEVLEPVFESDRAAVTGLRVRDRRGESSRVLTADLVVDACGRASHSPAWLERWGFGQVPQELVKIEVGYATGHFERRPGDLFGSQALSIAARPPKMTRAAALLGVEGNLWQVTLAGVLRDYPSTELSEFRQFARSLGVSAVFELVAGREPVDKLVQCRFPANRRLRYERLERFPSGYLVMGDALCSFNPVYGQGMSVGLTEARALDDCLAAGDERLAKRFFARARSIIDNPWTIATGEDLRYPQVEGSRPRGSAWLDRYMDRAHRATTRDPMVLRRFFEVASLLAPPSAMLAPGIAWRVFARGRGPGWVPPPRVAKA